MPRRSWGVSEQKIVAARQSWKCATCACVLPAAFELDHVQPLWAGGEDCIRTNAQALCGTCHATKTQLERVQRTSCLKAAKKAAQKADVKTMRDDTVALLENRFISFVHIPDVKRPRLAARRNAIEEFFRR